MREINIKKVGIPVVIIAIVGIVLGVVFFNLGTFTPPTQGSVGTGYIQFQIYDYESPSMTDGEIALIDFDTGELVGIYDTDEVIYVNKSVIATLHSVDLDPSDTRVVLPTTIVPLVEGGTLDNPKMNTISFWCKYPSANITSVKIVELEGVIGDYNHTHITADTLNTIELEILIDPIDYGYRNNSMFGASSYVPELYRPTQASAENITGFGAFLLLNGTEIIDVEVEGYSSPSYYIGSSYSIILLHPTFDGARNQTISFKPLSLPTAIGIFNGFIDDIATTYVQII